MQTETETKVCTSIIFNETLLHIAKNKNVIHIFTTIITIFNNSSKNPLLWILSYYKAIKITLRDCAETTQVYMNESKGDEIYQHIRETTALRFFVSVKISKK